MMILSEFEGRYVMTIDGAKKVTDQGLEAFRSILAENAAVGTLLKVEQSAPAYVSYSSRGGESWDEAYKRVRYGFADLLTVMKDTSSAGQDLAVEALCTPQVSNFLYALVGRAERGVMIYEIETQYSKDKTEFVLLLTLPQEAQTAILKANLGENLTTNFPNQSGKIFLDAGVAAQEEILATDAGKKAFGSVDGVRQNFHRQDQEREKVIIRTKQQLSGQISVLQEQLNAIQKTSQLLQHTQG